MRAAAALLAALGAAAASPALAQADRPPAEQPADSPFEGCLIREVRLLMPAKPREGEAGAGLEPLDPVNAELARNQLRTLAGGAYRARTVAEDIARLNRLGRFIPIESRVEPQSDGSVIVLFVLTPQPVIVDVQVVGNRRVSDEDIAEVVGLLAGTAVDQFQIDRAARSIEELYRSKGYYLAEVTLDRRELEESGVVLVRVREGERVKVTVITFEGNRSFASGELRRRITTRTAGLLEKGTLDDGVLDDDVAAIAQFYRDRGYLGVEVGRRVTPSSNRREAMVTFLIDEGPLYTLRDVRLDYADPEVAENSAAAALTPEQVIGLMKIKPGDVYSVNTLDESVERVRAAFGQLGYADVRILRREQRDLERPVVDLRLIIEQGERFRTGEVIIGNNDLTRHEVIRRQVLVRPDRPLDITAVAESERRLRQLNLFDPQPDGVRITVQEEDPAEPGYRDVLVQVTDTNTGALSLGAAASSDGGITGLISYRQRNFDVTDFPDSAGEFITGRAFRGAGQNFLIEALPGDRAESYTVSLSDPYVLETDYSAGGRLYYTSNDYTDYDEDRLGAKFSLGRRFGERWSGALTLRVENVDLRDIDADSPVDYFEAEDGSTVTGLGVQFNRTSTDHRFMPTRGSRVELAAEQVGALGGDHDFTKLRFEHTVFLPLRVSFEGHSTVFSVNTRASWIPQDQDDTPVFERYFLGGSSFRGFGHRAVSPMGLRADGTVTDEPVGGTFAFFLGAEVKQPVWKNVVAVVAFVDTGTVNEELSLDNYRVSVGFGVRLYIEQLSPIPLAFDVAVPLLREESDRKRLFTFSIDLPF